jgi:hypothetical protein
MTHRDAFSAFLSPARALGDYPGNASQHDMRHGGSRLTPGHDAGRRDEKAGQGL